MNSLENYYLSVHVECQYASSSGVTTFKYFFQLMLFVEQIIKFGRQERGQYMLIYVKCIPMF